MPPRQQPGQSQAASGGSSLPVEALAIVSKTNNPLALRIYNATGATAGAGNNINNGSGGEGSAESGRTAANKSLKYNFIANTMLDVIEERLSTSNSNSSDLYLGLLGVLEDLAVFGYVTNTQVKFLLFITVQDSSIRDVEVKAIFRGAHDAFVRLSMNVFWDNPAMPLPSSSSTSFISSSYSGQTSSQPQVGGKITNRRFLDALDRLHVGGGSGISSF